MKKRIICVILSLAAVFSLVGFHATETWFGSGENKSMQLSSGNLDFTVEGDLKLKDESALVLPGEELELAQAIVITNLSTIDTELRVRVECTYEGSTESFKWIEFVNDNNSNWEVDPEDGCIYYAPGGNRRIPGIEIPETTTVVETTIDGGAVVEDEVTETTTETTSRVYADNEIPLGGIIKISGKVPTELQGKELKLNFVIEAKQADFVEWSHFTSVEETTTVVTTTEETSTEENVNNG